jgi:hypothetical protein
MDFSLSTILGFISITIAIIATFIAWRFINHRILFFTLAILTSFGLKHFTTFATGVIMGISWGNGYVSFADRLHVYQLHDSLMAYAQLFITPAILWWLFIALRKSRQLP